MKISLEGQVALIVGGGCLGGGWGNGKAAAVAMARAGAHVGVLDSSEPAAIDTVEVIRQEGGSAVPLLADACSESQLQSAVEQLTSEFGAPSILHHNVGIGDVGGPLDTSLEQWERVLRVNLNSLFLSVKAVLPKMLSNGAGVVTAISSLAAIRWTGAPLLSYAVTKAGAIQFTQSIALQYAKQNIRANAIVVGKMDTPLAYRTYGALTPAQKEATRDARNASCPTGKMGDAWDVASMSVFLASDAARYVTGTAIAVDGGISAKC
jgi:NAD(P)-dependent dehydrogenase (short-subunit alcohol dehydrogenase family)